LNTSDFDFDLPEALIAQEPPAQRGGSRLLVLDRATGAVSHGIFSTLAEHLRADDLLVLNDTRVFPARLLGHRVPSGGAVECLLIGKLPNPESHIAPATPHSPQPDVRSSGPSGPPEYWEALVHPGQKLKPGAQVLFARDGVELYGEILAQRFFGRREVRLWTDGSIPVGDAVDRIGHIPLPPYIKRDDRPSDRERYQTVFARERGSIAAPTAGLHFTGDVLAQLAARGVERTAITLHVGYGTFKPVRVERVEEHEVDAEQFTVSAEAAAALTRARREGRRIIAVGTTTVRTLESLEVDAGGGVAPAAGATRLFIHPGHQFRLVDGMVTNFHLPKSSLLMLVAAFAGREAVLAAYREAVARGYRFYSYGDAMLVI
jgi:S-adenosylmethionine:tRNA ribosyltransferase-isomerase